MNTRKILVIFVSALLFIVLIGYGVIESKGLLLGPTIELYSPKEEMKTTESVILVEGRARRAKELTINGSKILMDTDGKFSVNLVLSPSYNIMTIVATDARGAQHTITRHLFQETKWLPNKVEKKEDVAASTTEEEPEIVSASTSVSN